jgi:CelD/BcsL family acetyltransferase involved in cellulose biosynthesis
VRLEAVGAAARENWHAALAAGGGTALVSQTPAWLDCVCAIGRHEDATRAYRADDGRVLVLPLARVRGVPAAAALEGSMPFGWSTGGIVGSAPVSADDVAAIVRDLSGRRTLRTSVRPSPAAHGVWAAAVRGPVVRTAHMEQTLDLAGGFDAVWARRFDRKVRSWHRKGERRLTLEWDDTGALVPVFDALYRRSVLRWARQQHEPPRLALWRAARRDPRRKFELVAERLGPACRIGVAWRAGEPAAAIVVLARGEHSTYWRGAMDRDVAAGTGANELLHVAAIEHACGTGRRFYHLGESEPGSSLARFKRGFGAEEQHVVGYRFERAPLTPAEELLRRGVKAIVGFRR